MDHHMAIWKIIETVSGNIEAVSGSDAQNRPSKHEFLVWEGKAADKAEALQSAEKADPRVDLEWIAFATRGILANSRISHPVPQLGRCQQTDC